MKVESHDYVIVGAGSAGCVLAHRLSAGFRHEVLLIEAGGPSHRALRIRAPGLYNLLWRTKFDWNFYTEPQEHVDGRKMYWPRGRVLGGTSCLNANVYIRGHRGNYDAWAAGGCAGWGYDDVLPYFRCSEDYRGTPSEFHGTGGPLTVSPPTAPLHPVSEAFVGAAARHLGVSQNDDFNGIEQEGVGAFHHTVRDGARASTAEAFLAPARSRWNLEVRADTTVTELLFEGTRCTGVRILQGKEIRTVLARREVILAAGAIGSPQLLMLSGVGPAAHLQAQGIDVRLDLPGVGENLQDHLLTVVGYETLAEGSPHLSRANLAAWVARYAMMGSGEVAQSPVNVGGFVRLNDTAPVPDLQFHFVPFGTPVPNSDEARDPPLGRKFAILPSLIYPKSRGTIRLRSRNPTDPPAIDPRYLSEDADLALLVDGIRLSREIAEAAPLSSFRGQEWAPGKDVRTDGELRADVRTRLNTIFHPVGTCKMGIDDQAVVDPELRVRGIEGLRVADASVMPTIVGGNTNAPTIMIAERAAALILAAARS